MDTALRRGARDRRHEGTQGLGAHVARLVRTGRRIEVPHPDRLGAGALIVTLFREALVRSGQREIDVVRAAGIPVRLQGRYVGNFRQILTGAPQHWVWVERWAALLGIDPRLPALASAWGRRSPDPETVAEDPHYTGPPKCSACWYAVRSESDALLRCMHGSSPVGVAMPVADEISVCRRFRQG
jgi:hypothetical protein